MLDYIALLMIFFLLCAVAAVIVVLGSLPGKIARRRGHPWPDAVSAASWIGLATGVFWPVAFIWAFLPVPQRLHDGTEPAGTASELAVRIAELEEAVKELRARTQEDAT